MRGAPVLAALQAVVVASAEEAVVALAQVVAADAAAVVVAGAGKKRSSFVYCSYDRVGGKEDGSSNEILGKSCQKQLPLPGSHSDHCFRNRIGREGARRGGCQTKDVLIAGGRCQSV